MSGGPGAIRTPDPQIRRLSQPTESKGIFGKPTQIQALSDQGLTICLQTEKRAANENPGALAGASGANWKSVGDLSKPYLKRAESATSLCLAIKACHPSDACEIMAAALSDLSAGMPIAPFYSPMNEAGFWADLATRAELKAYALACFKRLSQEDQAAFLRYVGGAH